MGGIRAKQGQRRKKPPRGLIGVKHLIRKTLEARGGDTTSDEIWFKLEKWDSYSPCDIVDDFTGNKLFEVYIDGEKIYQVDDKTGKDRSITRKTFQDYVAEVKKDLKNSRSY